MTLNFLMILKNKKLNVNQSKNPQTQRKRQ